MTFEPAQEDDVFEDRTCTRCKHEIGNDFMMRVLNEKLERWYGKGDLCLLIGN
jgi:hypothetical protein